MALKLNVITSEYPRLLFAASLPMPKLRSPKLFMTKDIKRNNVRNLSLSRSKNLIQQDVGKVDVLKSMDEWIRKSILPLLKPIEKSWQPQDFLPEPNSEGFFEQVKELRERAKELPDEYYVVLIGDMITEEALPTYQSRLTICDGVYDRTGVDDTPLAIWTRAWSAEENRHGDLLNKYLYLSGRVDMKQIEKTIQHLIGSGMDNGTGTNTYYGMIYTSFQERATFISHGNTARLAKKHGDESLARICGIIAADEKRHETAYTKIVGKLFDLDPEGAVIAFADSMRRKIQMPAHLMYDGRDPELFRHFCTVASRIGVYTAMDYVEIMEHFVEKWNVEKLRGLSCEGQRAQDYVCGLALRLRKLEERAHERGLLNLKESRAVRFSWIFDKDVRL